MGNTYNPSAGEMEAGGFLGLAGQAAWAYLVSNKQQEGGKRVEAVEEVRRHLLPRLTMLWVPQTHRVEGESPLPEAAL